MNKKMRILHEGDIINDYVIINREDTGCLLIHEKKTNEDMIVPAEHCLCTLNIKQSIVKRLLMD